MSKKWEPLTLRPANMPTEWSCISQSPGVRLCETSFVRRAKKHHLGEPTSFWVVFVEFNPEHWENQTLKYKYSVRGSNDVRPVPGVKHFKDLKDATNYAIFLMESTDKWITEINSDDAIRAYNRKIVEMKRIHS